MSPPLPLSCLQGRHTQALVADDPNGPRLAWFGSRMQPVDAGDLMMLMDEGWPRGSLDAPVPVTLFPQRATGYSGPPALRGHRDGLAAAHRFKLFDVQELDGTLRLELRDLVNALRIVLTLSLSPDSDVMSLSTRLTNTGVGHYTLDWLASATLPLPPGYSQCLSQHGRWGLEQQPLHRPIDMGALTITNRHGRTSHEHAPGVICGAAGFNADEGDVMLAHLAWSGNFQIQIERLPEGVALLQAGVWLEPGEISLAPGQSYETPALLVTRARGTNQGTQNFHRFARQQVLPAFTRTPRPVHANSWEAVYFDHDTATLIELVESAAGVGAERFVLDDGWFPYRRHDRAGLGDWTVDTVIYPAGLHPIVARVRELGMQFGLWFEPEMVNPDSDLYRAHPEWALRIDGIETPLARQQLALNMALEPVQQYLFEHIEALVGEYDIDYIKWDMNRDLVLAGDGRSLRSAAQPAALYALLKRLNQRFPALEIETCASGGARVDLGILRYTGRVWTSDNIDPIDRVGIQRGFLRFLPPEIMGAHVGHRHAHLTLRDTSLHTRGVVALQGQYGFELDARALNEDERAVVRHYTDLYKANRHWVSESTWWELTCPDPELSASMMVSADHAIAWVSAIALASMRSMRPAPLQLRGLDPSGRYRVRWASGNMEAVLAMAASAPPWCRTEPVLNGELLMNMGLPMPVLPPQMALLIELQRVPT